MEFILTWDLHHCWLPSIVLSGAVHTAGGEKQPSIFLSFERLIYSNNQSDKTHTHWRNSGMGFMDVTSDFLIEFKAYSTR